MRDQNERLVLSLVRQNGSLAKTDIARMTRLSAQTVSVIMRELEEEGLLLRQAPVRGKIGQPSIPMALNPDGAYFIGLKIGRRSAELVLIDFLGNVRAMLQNSYRYPAPRETVDFVTGGIMRMRAGLDSAQDKRIAGLGIAMPFELWNWADTAGAPRDVDGSVAASRHPRRHPGAVQLSRSISRTMRRPPAGPSWFSARPEICAISSISTSAPSPEAASSSTAGSTAARPATPARSAPCRCRAPMAGRRS